jgi:hypothetical protein
MKTTRDVLQKIHEACYSLRRFLKLKIILEFKNLFLVIIS